MLVWLHLCACGFLAVDGEEGIHVLWSLGSITDSTRSHRLYYYLYPRSLYAAGSFVRSIFAMLSFYRSNKECIFRRVCGRFEI